MSEDKAKRIAWTLFWGLLFWGWVAVNFFGEGGNPGEGGDPGSGHWKY